MRQLILIPCLMMCNVSIAQKKISAREMYDNMIAGMEKVKTCTYVLDMEERVWGKITSSQYISKINTAPLKIYAYSIRPNPGAEALYVEGKNNGKVLINPNRFPYINLSLSTNSMLLRKSHQYNIVQMGFSYFHEILVKNEKLNGAKFYASLVLRDNIVYNNKEYFVLEIQNDDFGYKNYTVLSGENVSDIANKLLVNDHMILELNTGIDDYDDVKPGQVIRVPNSFAKRILVYIDRNNYLPLVQFVYDDQGLYSKIQFSSFILNPVIQPEEFTRNYSKYKF